MARTRIIYRGYAIEIKPVGFTYTVAIGPTRPELSIFGRRIKEGFVSEEQALEFAKGRIDRIFKDHKPVSA